MQLKKMSIKKDEKAPMQAPRAPQPAYRRRRIGRNMHMAGAVERAGCGPPAAGEATPLPTAARFALN